MKCSVQMSLLQIGIRHSSFASSACVTSGKRGTSEGSGVSMSADFFLWGGFVFTLLWHGISWFGNEYSPGKESILGKDDSHFYTKQTLPFYKS